MPKCAFCSPRRKLQPAQPVSTRLWRRAGIAHGCHGVIGDSEHTATCPDRHSRHFAVLARIGPQPVPSQRASAERALILSGRSQERECCRWMAQATAGPCMCCPALASRSAGTRCLLQGPLQLFTAPTRAAARDWLSPGCHSLQVVYP